MKVDIKMPKLGESITEGTIVKWWKKPGDQIKKDETLLEISTDKVDSEIPSPYEGKIVEILKEENETVEVDSVIARLETDSKEAAKSNGGAKRPKEEQAEKKEEKETDAPQKEPEKKEQPKAPSRPSTDGGTIMDVKMPKLGESITEGTIVKWWKKPGDQVEKDETLLEISTDKVDSEIPSPFKGTLTEILAQENDVVEVDSVIAKIQTGAVAAVQKKASKKEEQVSEAASQIEEHPPKPEEEPSPEPLRVEKPPKGGRFYSPLVLNIARREGVSTSELEQIPGSGLEGRVTKKDMLKYVEEKKTGVAAPTRPAALREEKPSPEVSAKWQEKRAEIIAMDAIRKKIAEHMVKSKATSPHVYGVAECDFTRVMEIVQRNRIEFERRQGFKLTFNPFILQATVKALMDFPRVNSSVDGDNVVEKYFINLGIAVATERGLIVPVLKKAEEKNFVGLARAAYDLAMRARNRKLEIEDVQDSTFSLTNYGIFGNIIGLPIINQPNVAILGVGAIKKRPVVLETEQGDYIGIRSQGFLTLSYDHRIVDGELGDKFLQGVVHYIENTSGEEL
jgi:pyruvate dehydrogenase E2 component (dihydrolipoamide acetyltransferase)